MEMPNHDFRAVKAFHLAFILNQLLNECRFLQVKPNQQLYFPMKTKLVMKRNWEKT